MRERELVDTLCVLLRNPAEEWVPDKRLGYTLVNAKAGIEIWVASGFLFLEIYKPTAVCLNLVSRWRIWRAVRQARLNTLARALVGKPS